MNLADLWNSFRHNGFEKPPPFRYRPLPFDPTTAKRKLFSVPIERVEDPTLAELFFRKQMELDRQITMLVDRGTPRFLFGSMALYGTEPPKRSWSSWGRARARRDPASAWTRSTWSSVLCAR